MTRHHDTGYKDLISHPEFVQQLIEGFAPPALAARWTAKTDVYDLIRPEPPVAEDTLNSLVEDHSMLAENLENWMRRERREGRQEGRQEAAARILRKQLQLKFGPLPDWAEARLAAAPAERLEAWAEALLAAEDLPALLGAP